MGERKASRTAVQVCQGRAVAHGRLAVGRFDDPTALALLRLDGDTYESTMDGLVHLYDKLSPGGTLIVDDYYLFEAQRKAADEFRAARGIADPIVRIDHFGCYWVKGAPPP